MDKQGDWREANDCEGLRLIMSGLRNWREGEKSGGVGERRGGSEGWK